MDEILLRSLVRQLRILNLWVSVFGTLFLIGLLITGFLLFKLVTFVHDTEQRIQSLQDQTSNALNLQKQVCDTSTLKKLLNNSTDYCK